MRPSRRLTAEELDLLRLLRDGRQVTLTKPQYKRLSMRSMIRGSMQQPEITVVGREIVGSRNHTPPTTGRLLRISG